MVVLAFVALMGLKPWENEMVEPRLTLPFEAAVGDAVALEHSYLGGGVTAPVGPKPGSSSGKPEGDGRGPVLAVAPAQAVSVAVAAAPVTEPVAAGPETEPAGEGDEVPSDGTTAWEVPSEGTSSPVSTPLPDPGKAGPSRGPVAAGGPTIESCDGDEYVITVVLTPRGDEGSEAEEGEDAGEGESEGGDADVEADEPSVEIVLQRINEDGSVDELRLEGDLLDAQNLAVQLSLEGNCVVLETGVVSGDGAPSDGTTAWEVPSEWAPSPIPNPDSGGAVEDPGPEASPEPDSP